MQPIATAIGSLIVSAVRDGMPDAAAFGGWFPFPAGTAVAAAAAFALGRAVLPRFGDRRFGSLATGSVLALQFGALLAGPLPGKDSPWEGAALAAGLLPAIAAYLACALGSYAPVGATRGFALRDWIAPRLLCLPLVPFLVLSALLLVESAVPLVGLLVAERPEAEIARFGVVLSLLLLAGPYGIRLLFPARELTGPLAERLAAIGRRAGARYRKVFVWDTGTRPVVNACVAGLVPQNRYVFFTDDLLDMLDLDEVEAVFAHELSHISRRHFPLLLLLVLGFLLGLVGLSALAGGWVPGAVQVPLSIAACIAFLLGPFPRISRHLELEADVGALALGADPFAFTRALEKLCAASGRGHRRHTWRHFSIPYRVQAVRASMASGDFSRRVRIVSGVVRAAVLACALGGGALAWAAGSRLWPDGDEVRLGAARYLVEQARFHPALAGEAESRLVGLLADLELSRVPLTAREFIVLADRPADPELHPLVREERVRRQALGLLSRLYERTGREKDARRALEKARR